MLLFLKVTATLREEPILQCSQSLPSSSLSRQSLQHLTLTPAIQWASCALAEPGAKCQRAKVSVSFLYIFVCTISCAWSPGHHATGEISKTTLSHRAFVSGKRVLVMHSPAPAREGPSEPVSPCSKDLAHFTCSSHCHCCRMENNFLEMGAQMDKCFRRRLRVCTLVPGSPPQGGTKCTTWREVTYHR